MRRLQEFRAGGAKIKAGATDQELDMLRSDLGFEPPPVLLDWLRLSNGVVAGQGWTYGVIPNANIDEGGYDIVTTISGWPEWRSRRWIPIANDGCGNEYVLDATGAIMSGEGIFFVDTSDPETAAYGVASSLWSFLDFYLVADMGDTLWPFNEAFVVQRDPRIVDVCPVELLPWNVE